MKQLMKILICLCAVLALAGPASAATSQWKNGVASGEWSVSSNWIALGQPASNAVVYAYRTDGGSSVIKVAASATSLTLGMGWGTTSSSFTPSGATYATVHVNSGVTLQMSRYTYVYSTVAGSSSTIEIYGTYNACTTSTAVQSFNIGGASGASTDVVKVYGILNVGEFVAASGTGAILNVGTAGDGSNAVDIYNAGVVNVKAYSIGSSTSTTGHIYIEQGGYMWINSNVTSQVSTDVTNHRIQQGTFDTSGGLISATNLTSANYGYNSAHANGDGSTGATWINVPEPATVALLGLGSLLLLRRKR